MWLPARSYHDLIVAGSILVSLAASATVHRVPQDFIAIQAGIDACAAGDTVLIAPGFYEESLVGAAVDFTLLGDVSPDSVDLLGPSVSPAALARSDTLPCLRLLNSTAVNVQRIKWMNDHRMRANREVNDGGGIATGSTRLTVADCVFDSVFIGVYSWGPLAITRCVFRQCTMACIRAIDRPANISHCFFTGQGFRLVMVEDSSRVEHCVFQGQSYGYFLRGQGRSVVFADNQFLDYGPWPFAPVILHNRSDCRVERNLFSHCSPAVGCVEVYVMCHSSDYSPVVITDNIFENNTVTFGQGFPGIYIHCSDVQDDGELGEISNNVFVNCQSFLHFLGNAVVSTSRCLITNNRFQHLLPDEMPDVRSFVWEDDDSAVSSDDTVTIRQCLFDSAGLAAEATRGIIDARENWWGSATGPYQPDLNPEGRGGEISESILFIPWLTDTTEALGNRGAVQPASITLSVFPNPFNNSFRIAIAGFTRDDFLLRLFDLMGREQAILHRGPLTGGTVNFTAPPTLASGVYFVVASDKNHQIARKAILLK